MFLTASSILALAASATAVKTSRTFAVNHFYGNGPLTSGRADPIISPGVRSGHTHTIQGGSNFALTMSDTTLLNSSCTSSTVKNDKSNYWTPSMYFQHDNGTFEAVSLYYMNVYYFFEATDDEIKAFEPGLRMVVGDPSLRSPPKTAYNVLDPAEGTIQPVQFTCPRNSYSNPSYPVGSDGTTAGMVDPYNAGAGVGFPDVNCDALYSPLRADIHFPSCYNPEAGVDDYKNNMQFPSTKNGNTGRANCPTGWIHTPHIFYEVYWNTQWFADLWTGGQGKQPFVLANGDSTGYSLHGDFISGWDVDTLQQIIDNCNTGDSGMDQCPSLIGGESDTSKSCNIPIPEPAGAEAEVVTGLLAKLPGNNPVVGFMGTVAGSSSTTSAAAANSVSSAASSAASNPASSVASQAASSTASVAVSSASAATVASTAANAVDDSGYTATADGSTAATTEAPSVADDSAPATTEAPSAAAATMDVTVTSTDVDDVVITITRTVTREATAVATSVSSSNATLAGFNSIGCWSDTSSRVLSGETLVAIGNHQVTTSACIKHCDSKGFSMAGTEYGGQCFCGNSLVGSSQIDESKCDMACEGDKSETCGGGWALSVYEKPTSTRRKARHLHRHAHQNRS